MLGGIDTLLASATVPAATGSRLLWLSVAGNQLLGFVDGNLALAAVDSNLPLSGQAGARMGAGGSPSSVTAAWNAFQVTLLSVSQTVYDPRGLVVQSVDALQNVSSFAYDPVQNQVSATDPLNRTSTMVYDGNRRKTVDVNPLGLATSYAFDPASNPTGTTDPLGRTWSTGFDALNRPRAAIDPLGAIVTTMYDPVGRVAATIDPLNRAVTTLYDQASRPIATVDSLGQAVTTVYDPASRPVQTIDALGRTWSSVYDSASRKVASIDPLLNRNTMVYDPNSRVIATVDPLGRITSSTYDASNRRTESINPLGECVTTLYDAANNAIASIDPLARCTTSGYDPNNRLIVTMDPLGNAVTTTFDAAGQAVARIDARGFAVTSVYDRNSRKVATIDPLGYVATTMYDVANQPIAQVDALSRIVTSVFDQAGRTIATVDALSFRVSTVYDPASQAIATVDALGYRGTATYDLPNRKIATMDPLGHVVSTVFDAAGQAVASVNALGFITTTAFDQAGRAVATINPLGQAVTSIYDPASQVIAVVDANGNAVTAVYDQASRKIATVNALGYAVTNTYDQAGQRIVLIDANGNAVTFLFDQAGRDVGSIDPLSRRVTFGYDPNGNKTLKVDAVGNVCTMAYDADNRKVLEQFSNGTQHGYDWDPVGNRTLASDPTGVYTSTYSPRNQVLSVTNPDDKEIQYQYDARRSRVVMIDPDGGTFTNVYDPATRLIVVVNPQSQATTLSYDAANREIQKQLANGAVTNQNYDNADRLIGLSNAIANGNVVGRYTHTYDNAAHKLTALEANGDLTSWTYDKAYQLTQEQRSGNYVFNTNYQYDPAGNRTLRVEIDGQRVTSTYDAANQISTVNDSLLGVTTFTHDNNGNRIEKNAAGVPTYYGWDPLNRMTTAEPVSGVVALTYNADNKRVERATSTHATKFIYDFEKLLQEVDANSLDALKEYTWTDQQYGDLVSDYFPGPDQTRYHEFDAQGSTAALLDDDQATRAAWRYRAFGLVHSWLEGVNGSPADLASAMGMNLATAALRSPYGYGGKQSYWRDPMLEVYYLGFNPPYDPATGARLGKDSLYPESGANAYSYCQNDPVNNTDASGRESTSLLYVFEKSQRTYGLVTPKHYLTHKIYNKKNPSVLIERYVYSDDTATDGREIHARRTASLFDRDWLEQSLRYIDALEMELKSNKMYLQATSRKDPDPAGPTAIRIQLLESLLKKAKSDVQPVIGFFITDKGEVIRLGIVSKAQALANSDALGRLPNKYKTRVGELDPQTRQFLIRVGAAISLAANADLFMTGGELAASGTPGAVYAGNYLMFTSANRMIADTQDLVAGTPHQTLVGQLAEAAAKRGGVTNARAVANSVEILLAVGDFLVTANPSNLRPGPKYAFVGAGGRKYTSSLVANVPVAESVGKEILKAVNKTAVANGGHLVFMTVPEEAGDPAGAEVKATDANKKAYAQTADGEYWVATHGEFQPRGAGLRSHHAVMSRWMSERFGTKYNPANAPTVFMPTKQHYNTTSVYNTWKAQMAKKHGGQFDWKRISETDLRALSEKQLDAGHVPQKVRDEYWKDFDAFLKNLTEALK